MVTTHLISQLYHMVSSGVTGAGPKGKPAKKSDGKVQPDLKNFKVLYSGKVSEAAPKEFRRWSKCAREMKIDGKNPPTVDTFKVIESPLGVSFMVFTAKERTGHAKTNCHSYTDFKLNSLKGILASDEGVLGFNLCGTNPQEEILAATTKILTTNLSDEPELLKKQIAKIKVKRGDILVWRDVHLNLIHTTTFHRKDKKGWILDDKMSENKPAKRYLHDVATGLFRRSGMTEEMLFESESAHEYYFYVELRRPL